MTRTKTRTSCVAVASALGLALCAGAGSARAQGEPARVDGLAAVVGGNAPSPAVDTVLLSDVELCARIAWSGQHVDADVHGPMPNAALQHGLDELVNELLIAREALRVKAEAPAASEVARERARLAQNAGGEARLAAVMQALGAGDDELDAIARRRASVGAFLSANLQGVTVVTDSEVERALDEQGHNVVAADRAAVHSELRARMSRDALDRAIERWVTVLRSRTQVRLYVQY